MSERDRTAMTAARWRQVSRLFEAASALDPGERESFLEQQGGDDPELRWEVASLLAADERAPAFLELGAIDLVAPEGMPGGEPAADGEEELVGGDLAGRRLGHYEVLELLGRGGMGEVYVAEDRTLGRRVALKVLPSELAADPERRARLQREARIAASLNHPSLVTIHSVEEAEGIHFLTMELVDGETLTEWIPRSGASLAQLLDLGRQLVEALAAAHGRGIVHRDLKPGNLMITADRRVKVLDFGIAKLRPPGDGASSELSLAWGVKGTVPYMSPEQLAKGIADHRSDLFSLGVVLYEMATGRRPFPGDSVATVASAILRDPPRDLSELRPDLPAALQAVIHRCLEKDPERRFASAEELSRELLLLEQRSSESRERLSGTRISAGQPRPGKGLVESLAILPLANLSGDPEQEYLADGMTEALIAELAQIKALRVISRTSVMRLKGTTEPLPEIARKLDVEAIVEGSVFRAGGRVGITAQLVHGPTDSHLWAKRYERDVGDLLALQGEVARAIAGEIHLTLDPGERARLERPRSVDPEAHEAYLLGRYDLNQRTTVALERSVGHFERAVREDPAYALAYSGLADALALLAGAGHGATAERLAGRARAAATKAVELDEGLGQVHTSLAYVRFKLDWDWPGSEAEFRRAIELSPGSATAHHWYALYLSAMARHSEARAHIGRAQELDPLALIIRVAASRVCQFARDFPRAIEHSRKALELDPDYAEAHFNLALSFLYQSRHEEAVEELQTAIGLSGDRPLFLGALGHAYARRGWTGEAHRVERRLRELAESQYVSPVELSILYLGLGDHDTAIAHIREGIERREGPMVFTGVEPFADPVRSDPRVVECLRRVGLAR